MNHDMITLRPCRFCRKRVVERAGIKIHCSTIQRGELWLHLRPKTERILTILLARLHRIVTKDELISYLYPNPDYEPEYAYKSLDVYLFLLRAQLTSMDLHIHNTTKHGWEMRLYPVRYCRRINDRNKRLNAYERASAATGVGL